MKPILFTLIVLHANWCVLAQSEIDFKKMAELVVQVVDDHDKPISGATVYPYAMRGAEGGGHGYWNEELIGPPRPLSATIVPFKLDSADPKAMTLNTSRPNTAPNEKK